MAYQLQDSSLQTKLYSHQDLVDHIVFLMVVKHLMMVLLTLTEMSSSILKRLLQKGDIILPFVKLVVDKIMLSLINSRTLDSIMSKKMHLYEFHFH